MKMIFTDQQCGIFTLRHMGYFPCDYNTIKRRRISEAPFQKMQDDTGHTFV